MGPEHLVAERFDVEEEIGAGGMGQIFRARDRETGETVALKVVPLRSGLAAERFHREAHALSELRHPGIVRYLAHGTTGGRQGWLAMEWLEGEDLAARLERGHLTVPDAVTLVERVARVLGDMHGRGAVHRDVKPSNLFLVEGRLERVALLDFGIARLSGAAGHVTKTGVVIGTPGYLAPEQARGEGAIDPRTDVFGLGCVLFECLTGKRAFEGERPLALLAKVLSAPAPRLREVARDLPQALDGLVARMLSPEPEHRPVNGHAVAEALGHLEEPASSAGISSRAPGVIGGGEQQILSVVVAGGSRPADATTLAPEDVEESRRELRAIAERHGARLEPVADGSVVLTLHGAGAAVDQAARAGRCAHAVERILSDVPIALATGRGLIAGRLPVGEVIEQAVDLLERRRVGVCIDELTADLLGARFEVEMDGDARVLRWEKDPAHMPRTLLGRAMPCIGRTMELSMLRAMADECREEPGSRAILLTGAAGVGKSRVRHEFVRGFSRSHGEARVWIARGEEMRAGSPFGLIDQALARAVGLLEDAPLAERQLSMRRFVGSYLGDEEALRVSEFLGEMLGVRFDDQDRVQLRAAREDPQLMGDQMLQAWQDLLMGVCETGPLLLVLEDLQWGDVPSVRFVNAALRHLEERPLLVLAAARPEVSETFPDLWKGRSLQEVRIDRLSRRASEQLVRKALGAEVPDETVRRLSEHADGNALFLEELIRAEADPGDGAVLRGVPRSVLAMMQSRLEAMEPEARLLMRGASIFGQVFWRGGLSALVGDEVGEDDLDRWLDVWITRELVTPRSDARFSGERELVFRHSVVRDAAYRMLTESDRTLGHRLAGEWLERMGENDGALLAEHYEQGGEPRRALPWWSQAAENALEGNDLEAVLRHAQRAVDAGARDQELGTLRLLVSEAHRWRGDHDAAEEAGLQAMVLLPRGSAGWSRAVAETAGAYARVAAADELELLGDALLALDEDEGDTEALTVALARVANYLRYAGRVQSARRLHEHAERRAQKTSTPAARAWLHLLRAVESLFAGDLGDYLNQQRAVWAAFTESGASRRAANEAVNVGFALAELGSFREAEDALREAMDTAERLGLTDLVAVARQNLGTVLGELGEVDEAIRCEQEVVREFGARGDRRMEAASRLYLAHILMGSGQLEEAEREAKRASELLSDVPTLRPWAQASLASVRLAQGNVASAKALATEAARDLEEVGEIEVGESLVRRVAAEALLAAGDEEGATAAITQALRRLSERAAKIGDGELRRSFLEKVPDNARTLALFEALGGREPSPSHGG